MTDKPTAHPYDTALSSGFRFLTEVICWVAGPWALGKLHPTLIVVGVIVLVGLPSLFSTVGDKKTVVIPTPGPLRALLELFLYSVAAISPWFIWTDIWSSTAVVIVSLTLLFGLPRLKWLFKGAPL